MFANEARLCRIGRPPPHGTPIGARPGAVSGLVREYIYVHGAVLHGAAAPKDGTRVDPIMPASNTACFRAFLDALPRKFARQDILLVFDGAPAIAAAASPFPDLYRGSLPAALFARAQREGKSVG